MDAVDCLTVRCATMGELTVKLWTELWTHDISMSCRMNMNDMNELC